MPPAPRPDLPRSILFVVPRFHTNLAVAVQVLREAGCAVHVFAATSGGIEDHSAVTPRCFPHDTPPGEIRAALRAAAPDLVFIRSCKPLSRVVGRFCLLHRLRAYAYGQSPLTRRSRLGRRIRRFLDGQPLRRVTPARGLSRNLPRDPQAQYLPWPVKARADAGGAPDPHTGPLRILCVGKLAQRRKNQDKLVAALDALDRPDEIRLTLAGSTTSAASGVDRRHLEALVARAQQGPRAFPVRIAHDVPYHEMAGLYAQHHVCVLPSDAEPLGTSPLEAMAHGLVPVFSRQCGSAGCVTDGEDGFVVDVHDPEAMQALFRRLLDDRDVVARVGAAARRTAEADLGAEAFLERIALLCAR
jgi:glycosyltransferase involved in cell wall biosynthesis